jgi:hypothetical protein
MVGTLLGLGLLLAGAAAGAGMAKTLGGGKRPAAEAPKPTLITPASPETPTPPDTIKAASTNTAAAGAAGLKTRRRAAAGSAGRVSLATPSLIQQGIRASETPRTLLGS